MRQLVTQLKFTTLMLVALMGLSLAAPAVVHADRCIDGRSFLEFPTWDQYLGHNQVDCHITGPGGPDDPFQFPQDLFRVLVALVEIMIRLAAYIAVGIIIYGGFKFMVSQGSPDKIAEAKSILSDAIVGLVIALISVAIISFAAQQI